MSLKINNLTKGKFDNIQTNSFMEIDIAKVYPNPNQPRKNFNEEYIKELSESIIQNGLIQPIAVTKKDDGYMIISGECRYKAHLKANLKSIKVYILKANDKKVEELSLIENIQRDDLTPFEIAKFIKRLWDNGNYEKKKDLALAIGKKDTYVSKALSVSHLDETIVKDIESKQLNIGLSVLDEISRAGDDEMQKLVYEEYNKGNIKRDDIKSLKSKDTSSWPKRVTNNEKEIVKREEKKEKIVFQYTNRSKVKKFLDDILILEDETITDDAFGNIELYELKQQKKYRITVERI